MSERIGAYSPETAKMVLEVINNLKRSGLVLEGTAAKKYNAPPNTPIYFRNDSGEEVPPYACMQVTGTVDSNGQNFFTIDKPADEDGTSGAYLFNLHRPVAIDEFGIGDAGVEARALSGGSLNPSDRASASTGSWEVKQANGGPFICGGDDDIGENVVRLFLYSQGGGSGSIIEFEILTVTSSSSSSSSGSVSASDSSDTESGQCDDRADDAPTAVTAKILRRPCGVEVVPAEKGGEVTVIDSVGGFLKERQADELVGKQGYAVYLTNPDYVTSSSVTSSTDPDNDRCQWIIIWIDWFRWVSVVEDIIFGDSEITVKRRNVKVWDDCKLEDEVIEGTDCVEPSSSVA